VSFTDLTNTNQLAVHTVFCWKKVTATWNTDSLSCWQQIVDENRPICYVL